MSKTIRYEQQSFHIKPHSESKKHSNKKWRLKSKNAVKRLFLEMVTDRPPVSEWEYE